METILEQGKITGKQLMFTVACFIHGSTLLSAFVVNVTRQDSCYAILLAFAASIPVALMYIKFFEIFPGKNIISINDIVFGKIIGKIVSCFYLFFFFSLVFLNVREVCNFVTGYILPETPLYAVSILFVTVCAYAAYKGITVMARYAFLCSALIFGFKIFSTVLLFPQMDFSNYLPAFQLPLINYVNSVHVLLTLPFSEFMVFMMIFPYVVENDREKIKKYFFSGMVIGFVLMLIVCIRDWAVLGDVATVVTQATFQATRMINIDDVLSRLEVLFAVGLLVLQFYKVSILLYASSIATAQIFGLKSYKSLVPVLGILAICYSIIVWDTVAESSYWGSNVAPFYSSFFEIVIPGITFIIVLIKQRKNKKNKKEYST